VCLEGSCVIALDRLKLLLFWPLICFSVRHYYASGLFVMTAPASVQSDSEVMLLVTLVMLGVFNGLNLLLEVIRNTLIWNVPVGLILL
jgi:hypothetical protein